MTEADNDIQSPNSNVGPNSSQGSPSPKKAFMSPTFSQTSSRSPRLSRSLDHVPPEVSTLAALPAKERIRLEAEFQKARQRPRQQQTMTPGTARQITMQEMRRKAQELSRQTKHEVNREKTELRLASAQVRRGPVVGSPSSWTKSTEQRGQFQLWNREGSLPAFVVNHATADRAPAVGSYGGSTSIDLIGPQTPSRSKRVSPASSLRRGDVSPMFDDLQSTTHTEE